MACSPENCLLLLMLPVYLKKLFIENLEYQIKPFVITVNQTRNLLV